MSQIEIPIPSQPKNIVAVCACLDGDDRGNVVILRKSLDPRYLVGECSYCGKKYVKEAS